MPDVHCEHIEHAVSDVDVHAVIAYCTPLAQVLHDAHSCNTPSVERDNDPLNLVVGHVHPDNGVKILQRN